MSADTNDPSVALRSSRSIQEFRIDFFLEEEFSVDPAFVQAFVDACRPAMSVRRVEQVSHSVSDKHGETDLFVLLTVAQPDGRIARVALLIEDKISAGFQPRQSQRYRERGTEGVNDGRWDAFLTVLVAPTAYISGEQGFDATVSLEQIKEWICPGDEQRRAFKIAKFDEAIQKKTATGVQIIDSAMTIFRLAYYGYLQDFNQQHGTDFVMRPPAPTYFRDSWFRLKSAGFPPWIEFRHMAQAGNIEISFKETDFSKAAPIAGLLESGMELIPTGKHKQHVTIRIAAPKIAAFDSFERDQPKVRAALLSAEKLWRLYRHKRARFEAILVLARLV